MSAYRIESEFQPTGDQPRAIKELVEGLRRGDPYQTLLGATGTGKTFAVSNVVQQLDRPTLVMSHNKTLAAQLYAEFKGFFPDNAVEFFISYYDYYQPEAYIVHSDTYIEKDMAINEQIDRLRLRATSALVSGRRDVLIVASVSCIYGLGSPEEYKAQIVQLKTGQTIKRNDLLHGLINIFYARNDVEFGPGAVRVRGDVVEVFPAYLEDRAYRIAFWGDDIERLSVFDPLTGKDLKEEPLLTIYPGQDLRHAAGDDAPGHQEHRRGAALAPGRAPRHRQARRGAAPGAAHALRHRDDEGGGLLLGHRELQPPPHGPAPRPPPVLPVRLLPRRLPARRRREPRHHSAGAGDVQRRPARARSTSSSTASGCRARSTTAR